jgi:hypothetical protein
VSKEHEQEYFDALKEIARYRPSEWFEDHSQKEYGLSPREALEMAYDNMQARAAAAIRGRTRPKIRVNGQINPVPSCTSTAPPREKGTE